MIKKVKQVFDEVIDECESINESSIQHLILSADSLLDAELIVEWMGAIANRAYAAGNEDGVSKKMVLPLPEDAEPLKKHQEEFGELWGADPDCWHEADPLYWNGIKCIKCGGHFVTNLLKISMRSGRLIKDELD